MWIDQDTIVWITIFVILYVIVAMGCYFAVVSDSKAAKWIIATMWPVFSLFLISLRIFQWLVKERE